ncbi:MAG: hypothetical protein ABMA01_16280 [Chthoniobacteraceae bacterium]
MRTFLLITNAAVAALFIGFFAYTFLGRQHIDGIAREFVTAKTQKFITPAVDVAEEALRSELTRRLLTETQAAAVESEIAEFRAQPADYIRRLTSAHAPPKPESFLAKVSEKIYGWKERIRTHYNKVLRRLFTDLRIFSGSNVVAACIAFLCAWRSPGRPSLQLKLVSALLLIAIGLSIYFYIDGFSFFTILFDWYLGWSYPVLMALVFISIYIDLGSHRRANAAG